MIPLWIVLIASFIGTAYLFRRAWRDAKREQHLNLLRSRPMPRRHNEGSLLPWWEQ